VVKEEVKLWSISLRSYFFIVKCVIFVYNVKILQEGCPWRVHANKGVWKIDWTCFIQLPFARKPVCQHGRGPRTSG
jgi:hypothetical protein